MSLRYVKLYLLILAVFLPLDLFWLGVLAPGFYQAQLGHLLTGSINWWAALSFYLLYGVGLLLFAVVPGLRRHSLTIALAGGAGFGFFTYMTYNLTNMATMPGWPLRLVLVDIGWGATLCAVTAAAVYLLGRRWA